MNQTELKISLLKKRGYVCEHCLLRLATDLHHCLIHRDIRYKELDCEENYMIVCHECHMAGKVNSYEVKEKFWSAQCRRYGEAHMLQWLENLPLKVKPRFTNAKESPRLISHRQRPAPVSRPR